MSMDKAKYALRTRRLNVGGVQRAERHSGNVRIVVFFDDARNEYVTHIRVDGESYFGSVGLPGVLTQAVDCPEAFDDAARAAIAFAEDEGFEGMQLEYDPIRDVGGCIVGLARVALIRGRKR